MMYVYVLCMYVSVSVFVPCQPLTTMPECSQTPRRQRPDYLADFTSGSSADNSCSSSDEEEEERRKAGGGGGRGGEKREKKVSYDLGESKEKNLAERSGKAAGCIKVSKCVFIKKTERWCLTRTLFPALFLSCFLDRVQVPKGQNPTVLVPVSYYYLSATEAQFALSWTELET